MRIETEHALMVSYDDEYVGYFTGKIIIGPLGGFSLEIVNNAPSEGEALAHAWRTPDEGAANRTAETLARHSPREIKITRVEIRREAKSDL